MKYIAFLMAAAVLVLPAAAKAEGFSAEQKSEIEAVVKNYLDKHPEAVIEAIQKYQANEQLAEEERAKKSITDNIKNLTGADLPAIGKEDASVTVVEFFDYNCGYCKRAVPDIQSILKENDDVRFVFQEMPILGPPSRVASQYALAAHKQGRYFDYHVALMDHRGAKTEEEMQKIAKEIGLDVDQMKKDAASKEVGAMLDDSLKLARDIGINGTPAFIVDGALFRGYLGPEGLKQEIAKAQKN